jgi:hypothetical protein
MIYLQPKTILPAQENKMNDLKQKLIELDLNLSALRRPNSPGQSGGYWKAVEDRKKTVDAIDKLEREQSRSEMLQQAPPATA